MIKEVRLQDKLVLITGASLALVARDRKRLQQTAEQARQAGAGQVAVYACDLRQIDQLSSTVDEIVAQFGQIDVLINNAGIWQKLMPLDQIPEDVVEDVITTNLTAVIHLTRLVLPVLKQRDEAAIINIVSKSGVVPQTGQSVYTASKYGVRGFTEVLKLELADTPIKVAAVYQSGTNTQMFAKAGETFATDDFTDPADLADVVAYMLTRPDKIWLHDVRIEK